MAASTPTTALSAKRMKEEIFADRLPKCTACKKIVKPDIVFFGEDLPEKFHKSLDGDFKECDLLIIMGTSLEVHPFAALAQYPGPRCLRLLINRDAVGRPKFTTWMDDQNDDCLRQHPLGTGLDENSESCIDLAEQYSKTTFTHPRRGSSGT
ncbi:NAD-dependent protein deacetylase Sirt2-like [Drosophila subobscura]|uniref:NAD-dependent protein deacetylase Sirt2-like n=2 Tax=Drosophila subobscura TaxID=7241 RepID=UPI00155A3678|nr:NAD-dependent protein deacetylase Sirt2-like [Drosophila subobscura]